MPKSLLAVAALSGAAIFLALRAADRLTRSEKGGIRGKTFVVTGASSGFGRGVALELGRNGANVVLAARRANLLEDVAAQIGASGGAALVVPTDVSDPAQMQHLADSAVARFGRIDSWINNAGVGAIGRFEDIPITDHSRVVDVNIKGVIIGSHVALNLFRRQGRGILVNVGSVEGKIPIGYHASYAASKHAVLGLSNAIRQELRLAGLLGPIRVSTVMPWAADTPYFTHSANYSGHASRMVTLDDPQKVVEAIVMAAVKPRQMVAVGIKSKISVTGHKIAPGLSEHFAADVVHKAQMVDAPPGPDTSGNLHAPIMAGSGIEGGLREQLQQDRKNQGRAAAPARAGGVAQPGDVVHR